MPDEQDNISKHDKIQDEHIRKNAEHIAQQTTYLHEIRDYFLPEAEKERKRRWRKMIASMVTHFLIALAFLAGLWELGGWYWDRLEIQEMADRYAKVANEMYYVEGNPKVALAFLNRAITLQEANAEYRFQRAYVEGMSVARVLLNLKRPLNKTELDQAHQALAQAKFLNGLQPERAEPYILEGQIYLSIKEYQRAHKKILKAISLDPNSDFAYVRLATLLVEMNKTDEANAALDKAIELNPKSKWAWLWRGIILSDKDNKAARDAFNKTLKIDSRFDLAWYNLGLTWSTNGIKEYAKAQENIERALKLNPDYKQAYFSIGMLHGFQNNYKLAKIYMDKAILIDPGYLMAIKMRGRILTDMGQYKNAIDDFNNALLLNPKDVILYIYRAKAMVKLNKFDDAMSDLRFADELQKDNKRTILTMGTVLLQAGNIKQSIETFKRAIKIDDKYADAHAGIANAYIASGAPQDALKSLNRAIETTQYRPERFVFKKGQLLEKEGNMNEALTAYHKATELAPKQFTAWLAQAKLCVKLQKHEEAIKALDHCLKLRPENKEARELKVLLIKK